MQELPLNSTNHTGVYSELRCTEKNTIILFMIFCIFTKINNNYW